MRWFLPSWTCVLWTRRPLVIRSHCLYFTDKWIWQRNCLGKAIPQASQQLLPSFFTSIAEGKGRIWQLLLYQGDTETITCIAWSQSSSFPPLCRMDTCRKLPLHYKHFERVCSHERQTDRREADRRKPLNVSIISEFLCSSAKLIHLFHSLWCVSVLEVKRTLHGD